MVVTDITSGRYLYPTLNWDESVGYSEIQCHVNQYSLFTSSDKAQVPALTVYIAAENNGTINLKLADLQSEKSMS